MSRWGAVIFAHALLPAPATADQAYGPVDATSQETGEEQPPGGAEPCRTEEQEEGIILVCRELTDAERYLSPLPRQVDSDRSIIPGLTDPPCWVQPRAGGGLCIRLGWAPEPAVMVDLSAFPERLTDEEAKHVVAVEAAALEESPVLTGERVPIDLSED